MADRPWWRDPRQLPPGAARRRAGPMCRRDVRGMRIAWAVGVVAVVVALAFGSVAFALVVLAVMAFQAVVILTPEQRRTVLGRRPSS